MSSLLVRLGLEYAPKSHVEHQLLSGIFDSFTFDDDLPINEFTRVLSPTGRDIDDHVSISNVLNFLCVQTSASVTAILMDVNNNTTTITVNRVFNLVGSAIKSFTLANPDPQNTVNVKVVYS